MLTARVLVLILVFVFVFVCVWYLCVRLYVYGICISRVSNDYSKSNALMARMHLRLIIDTHKNICVYIHIMFDLYAYAGRRGCSSGM